MTEPTTFGLDPVRRIHSPDFLDFLADCWSDWQAAGFEGEAIATCWPSRAVPRTIVPRHIDGRIGYTGSQNIADASFAPKKRYAPWVDCMVRVWGPVVRDLQVSVDAALR